MNQKQILKELNLGDNNLNKIYAKQLLSLFNLINGIEKLPGFKVILKEIKGNIEMVNELPEINRMNDDYYNRKLMQNNLKEIFGNFEQWQNIELVHDKGSYKFSLPIGNTYYNTIASMAGITNFETKKEDEIKVLNTVSIESLLLKGFSKAVKFISKDWLRPAMCGVCLNFENYKVEVIGTDAHRLFISEKRQASEKDKLQLIINGEDAKLIAKIKPESEITEIHILEDDKIMIENKIYNLIDARYPDYNAVIPKYDKYMEFETKEMIKQVNKVKVYANKTTDQVNFHLNGNIALSACDIDFYFESNSEMPYISKNFVDTDIAFNGKLLVDSLGILKDKTIKMYSDGEPTRAAIFTNDIDTVLVMPLMMNA